MSEPGHPRLIVKILHVVVDRAYRESGGCPSLPALYVDSLAGYRAVGVPVVDRGCSASGCPASLVGYSTQRL